jgi:LmbE family N-acetylglucosaminyl deacetylase
MNFMSIVVFAPHPDDEVIMTAGIIKDLIDRGERVIVVNVTNGDVLGQESGKVRILESISAMNLLELSSDNHIFMGYGDGTLWDLYNSETVNKLIPSNTVYTNAIPDYVQDFHTLMYKKPGYYNKRTLFSDILTIIRIYKPSHIYTTSLYDRLPDHRALYLFIVDAIIKIKEEYHNYSPVLHETIVHSPEENPPWPSLEVDPTPLQKYSKPSGLDLTPLDWDLVEDIPLPLNMQIMPRTKNLKYNALIRYESQLSDYLKSFIKRNEFFWSRDFSNIALLASVEVSSESKSTNQLGLSAVDGVIGGYPICPSKEWSADGELNGAWIKLTWPRTYLINKVILYDRPNLSDQILKGTLTFSDGSSLKVNSLPNNGRGYIITFQPKLVSWIKFTIDNALGYNTGLAEFEVYSSNISYKAEVLASSQSLSENQIGYSAIDGRVDGYPGDVKREWVTKGELKGAWIKLIWEKEYTVESVVLYDRCNEFDNILKGTLKFSDGSNVSVGHLRRDKVGDVISFSPKSITWVQFTVEEAVGENVGLAELEVHVKSEV